MESLCSSSQVNYTEQHVGNTQSGYIASFFILISCFLNAFMITPQCFLIIKNASILYVNFSDGRS